MWDKNEWQVRMGRQESAHVDLLQVTVSPSGILGRSKPSIVAGWWLQTDSIFSASSFGPSVVPLQMNIYAPPMAEAGHRSRDDAR